MTCELEILVGSHTSGSASGRKSDIQSTWEELHRRVSRDQCWSDTLFLEGRRGGKGEEENWHLSIYPKRLNSNLEVTKILRITKIEFIALVEMADWVPCDLNRFLCLASKLLLKLPVGFPIICFSLLLTVTCTHSFVEGILEFRYPISHVTKKDITDEGAHFYNCICSW